MGDGEYASTFDMLEFRDRLQGFNRDDKGASRLTKFCNRIGDDTNSADMLSGIEDFSLPKDAKWNLRFFG